MGGDIKLQAFGEHVHVSVHSWATDVKKKPQSHTHPHSHLRIPFLTKKRHSTRGTGAEAAATEARAEEALPERGGSSGSGAGIGTHAGPRREDDLEEIVTTTGEDRRRRNDSSS